MQSIKRKLGKIVIVSCVNESTLAIEWIDWLTIGKIFCEEVNVLKNDKSKKRFSSPIFSSSLIDVSLAKVSKLSLKMTFHENIIYLVPFFIHL